MEAVEDQIQQQLGDLDLIGPDALFPAVEIQLDLDLLGLGGGRHIQRLMDQFIGAYQMEGGVGIFPGQVAEAGDDGLGLPGGVVDLQQVIINLPVRGKLFQRHHAVAHDGGQQIVELVGNGRGEGSHQLKPLMVGQLLALFPDGFHSRFLLPQSFRLLPQPGQMTEGIQDHGQSHHRCHAAQTEQQGGNLPVKDTNATDSAANGQGGSHAEEKYRFSRFGMVFHGDSPLRNSENLIIL